MLRHCADQILALGALQEIEVRINVVFLRRIVGTVDAGHLDAQVADRKLVTTFILRRLATARPTTAES